MPLINVILFAANNLPGMYINRYIKIIASMKLQERYVDHEQIKLLEAEVGGACIFFQYFGMRHIYFAETVPLYQIAKKYWSYWYIIYVITIIKREFLVRTK